MHQFERCSIFGCSKCSIKIHFDINYFEIHYSKLTNFILVQKINFCRNWICLFFLRTRVIEYQLCKITQPVIAHPLSDDALESLLKYRRLTLRQVSVIFGSVTSSVSQR
jgi:hypothetical protein